MLTINQLLKKKRKKKPNKYSKKALKNQPFRKGICVKIYNTSPKKPNSAVRKVAKVKLNNDKFVIVAIPGQGHTLQQFSNVLIRGGRTRDVPGVKYKAIKGKYDFSFLEEFRRKNARSKYGVKIMKTLDV